MLLGSPSLETLLRCKHIPMSASAVHKTTVSESWHDIDRSSQRFVAPDLRV